MGRIRIHLPPPQAYELLLHLINRHIHAQLVNRAAGRVLLSAHRNEPSLHAAIAGPDAPRCNYATSSVAAARHIGNFFATRAAQQGVAAVLWRRPGRYHGKIKPLIDAVRDGGVQTSIAMPREMPLAPDTRN